VRSFPFLFFVRSDWEVNAGWNLFPFLPPFSLEDSPLFPSLFWAGRLQKAEPGAEGGFSPTPLPFSCVMGDGPQDRRRSPPTCSQPLWPDIERRCCLDPSPLSRPLPFTPILNRVLSPFSSSLSEVRILSLSVEWRVRM